MVKQHLQIVAVPAVVALIAVWAGAPVGTVLLVAIVVACPLMMLFMMRSMNGHGTPNAHGRSQDGSSGHHPDRS